MSKPSRCFQVPPFLASKERTANCRPVLITSGSPGNLTDQSVSGFILAAPRLVSRRHADAMRQHRREESAFSPDPGEQWGPKLRLLTCCWSTRQNIWMVLQRAQEHVQLRLRCKGKVHREPSAACGSHQTSVSSNPFFRLRAEGPAEVIRFILLGCFSWKCFSNEGFWAFPFSHICR